jgi:hypothetical protein
MKGKTHILQTPYWAKFKESYGTPSIHAGGIFYTKHSIPLTSSCFALSPHVNPSVVDFEELRESLERNNCVGLRFDVPNVIKGSDDEKKALEIFEKHCVRSPRSEFAKANFLLNLTQSEEKILKEMHPKQRYNIKYAIKKGVKARISTSKEDLEKFYNLYKETSQRQKYFPRPKIYFEKLWEIFEPEGLSYLLMVEYEGELLASWMLFIYDKVLYYPYGGSAEKYKNLQASCLTGWGAIRFGREKKCEIFDMWGAAEDLNNEKDPFYGFSNFKAKFGGAHVIYIDSYDLVLNQAIYTIFNMANNLRWKLLTTLR